MSTPGRARLWLSPHSFCIYIYIFLSFSSQLLPLPVLLFQRHGAKHGFLDSHSARRRTALQLPAKTPYLCLAACRQDGGVRAGVGWGGGKGYRKRWENTRKGLVGRRRDEEMLKCLTPKFCFGLLSSSFFIFSIWTCNISRNSKVLQLFWSLTPGSPTSVQKRRVPKKEKNRKTHVICIQQITWWD